MSYDPSKTDRAFPRMVWEDSDKSGVRQSAGTKVVPWELCRLITAVRSFTNWPVAHSGNPNDSIADTHKLIEQDFLFIASMQIDISESFYKLESPKFPLHVDVEVTHRGNSSSRKIYSLFHEKASLPYAVCQIDDVLVDGKSRKPMTHPSWWREKFVYINNGPKELIGQWPSSSELVKVTAEEYMVLYNDIDTNQHTNYSTYIKFSYDSIVKTAMDKSFRMLNVDHLEKGIKTLAMTFHGETNYRDILTVELWEDLARPGCIFSNIKKSDDSKCCSLVFEFNGPSSHSKAGKL